MKIDKLDKVFSEYIRTRDSLAYWNRYFCCISCGQVKPYDEGDCGHYIPRTHMATRFDENNAHFECVVCNRATTNHMEWYRENLIRKIGLEAVETLERKKHETKKWSPSEIEEMIEYYKGKTKELKEK